MRLMRLLVVLTLALAALVPAAAKADLLDLQLSPVLLDFIASAPASQDLVAGEGKFFNTSQGTSGQFTISAHGTPADAHGSVRINFTNFADERGEVECLFVTGNRATAAGTLDEPAVIGSISFEFFIVPVEDNGEPGGLVPDQANLILTSGLNFATLADCGAGTFGPSTSPLVQGNVVVMDRP